MNQAEFANLIRGAIDGAHLVTAKGTKLTHIEEGALTELEVNVGAVQHVAFSLDVPKRTPFGIFNAATSGATSRNDLTVVCWRDGDSPVVFVIEVKDSKKTLGGHKQLEAGAAFVEYLFKILKQLDPRCPTQPVVRAILAYHLPRPMQGYTNLKKFRPSFRKEGTLLRADWKLTVPLPLAQFVAAI